MDIVFQEKSTRYIEVCYSLAITYASLIGSVSAVIFYMGSAVSKRVKSKCYEITFVAHDSKIYTWVQLYIYCL